MSKEQILIDALKELIELKYIKDNQGKTEDYLRRQPIAWANAKKVVMQHTLSQQESQPSEETTYYRTVKASERLPEKEDYYVANSIWVGDDMKLPNFRSDTYFRNGKWQDSDGWEVVEWLEPISMRLVQEEQAIKIVTEKMNALVKKTEQELIETLQSFKQPNNQIK